MDTIAPITAVIGAPVRREALPSLPPPKAPAAPFGTPKSAALAGTSKAAIAFEAVVLRTFVEAMLPKEGFGTGTAGHMWRGQMAEALAGTLAGSGGVGIASALDIA